MYRSFFLLVFILVQYSDKFMHDFVVMLLYSICTIQYNTMYKFVRVLDNSPRSSYHKVRISKFILLIFRSRGRFSLTASSTYVKSSFEQSP